MESSEYIESLSTKVNWEYNTDGNGLCSAAENLMRQVRGRNGYRLLELETSAYQSVGLAFANIARGVEFNDEDANSVAAENAFFCLSKSLIEKNNHWCAPALFSLLMVFPGFLKDKLISTHCAVAEKEIGMPIGLALGGNPFSSPNLSDFRDQAIGYRFAIMDYLLPLFYNCEERRYLIPEDLPYFIPDEMRISGFSQAKEDLSRKYRVKLSEGKTYFLQMYEECKQTLVRKKSYYGDSIAANTYLSEEEVEGI